MACDSETLDWQVSPLLAQEGPEDRQAPEPRDVLDPRRGRAPRAGGPVLQGPLAAALTPTGRPEDSMQVTTTQGIEGKRITSYFGIVTGEAILGANLFKDLFAGIRDIVGGRSATYEAELQRARDIAITELTQRAQ